MISNKVLEQVRSIFRSIGDCSLINETEENKSTNGIIQWWNVRGDCVLVQIFDDGDGFQIYLPSKVLTVDGLPNELKKYLNISN